MHIADVESLWAKARPYVSSDLDPLQTLSIRQHLEDTAAVAGHIWDDFLAPHIKEMLAVELGSDEVARASFVFLAGAHDIGKAAPAFSAQHRRAADQAQAAGFIHPPQLAPGTLLTPRLRHEVISGVALREWLRNTFAVKRLPIVHSWLGPVLAHHGAPASKQVFSAALLDSLSLGGQRWADARIVLLDHIDSVTGFSKIIKEKLPALPRLTSHAQTILSGAVIMSDWIASNEHYFPLDFVGATQKRAQAGWGSLALPGPWTSWDHPADADEHLRERFNLDASAQARPMQSAVRQLASESQEPGLIIVEAGMGEGKTEAALMCAEILASKFGHGGVFVGLPTQASTNAMFERVTHWLEQFPLTEGQAPPTTFLAHGKRDLNETYHTAYKEAWRRYFGPHVSDESNKKQLHSSVVAHSWLTDRRRGLLAPFTIGTIDHALMLALKMRFVTLRHLAFAGKVVVLDEVHAADTYMSQFLEDALDWLGAMGVPVIMLSATLPASRREAFIRAYQGQAKPKEGRRQTTLPVEAYPRLTLAERSGRVVERSSESTGVVRELTVHRLGNTPEDLIELIKRKGKDGGRVAVIRNTVNEVQETSELLREAFPNAHHYISHARFMGNDRAERDNLLLDHFGKGGSAPEGELSIVVASQTVEQSLDLDFDLMITDLAPVDLILQRSGRLHRHAQRDAIRPPLLRKAELWISGVDWNATPFAPTRGSCAVYGEHLLLRTALALGLVDKSQVQVQIPADIPELVDRTYERPVHPPAGWEDALEKAEQKFVEETKEARRKPQAALLHEPSTMKDIFGLISGGLSEDGTDERVSMGVRDAADNVEVLMAQMIDGQLCIPQWVSEHGGTPLPMYEAPPADVSRILKRCSLNITEHLLHKTSIDSFIEHLERTAMVDWQDSPELRGELILVFNEDLTYSTDWFTMHYDPTFGLKVVKHD